MQGDFKSSKAQSQASPRFLRDLDVARRYNVSRATIWRWVRIGVFPGPRRIGPATTRWDVADIERHEAETSANSGRQHG